jgi:transposase
LRKVLPELLSSPPEALSQRILRLIAELDQAWRRLDERIEVVSAEIESLSDNHAACQRWREPRPSVLQRFRQLVEGLLP